MIQNNRLPRLFANIAIICYAYAFIALAALHVLEPEYPPASSFISFYAVGRYGWIMTTWFLAMSGALLALAAGLMNSGLRSPTAWLGSSMLLIASLGLITSAIFPSDVPGGQSTHTGSIHDLSFLLNISTCFLAALLLSVSFAKHPGWRQRARASWLLTGLIVLMFVVQFLTMHKGMPYGIVNRLFVLVLFAWGLTIALHMRSPVSAQAPAR